MNLYLFIHIQRDTIKHLKTKKNQSKWHGFNRHRYQYYSMENYSAQFLMKVDTMISYTCLSIMGKDLQLYCQPHYANECVDSTLWNLHPILCKATTFKTLVPNFLLNLIVMYKELIPNQNATPSFFQQIFEGLLSQGTRNWETVGTKKERSLYSLRSYPHAER